MPEITGTGTPASAPAAAPTTTQSVFGEMFEQGGAPQSFDVFGRDIVYTPAGGSAVTITAIVDPEPERIEDEDQGATAVQEARVTIWLDAATGVADPAQGDKVTDGGKDWYVTEIDADSDKGVATLTIRREQVYERSREGYRGR